ncbi:hypothetical protein SNEBB_005370 [Seison nebaliae]|nr:hypothetical protein SNEBB_005370 [Seison nebaliae]
MADVEAPAKTVLSFTEKLTGDTYTKTRMLGEGAFGVVMEMIHKKPDGTEIARRAVKIIDKERLTHSTYDLWLRVKIEIDVHGMCDHPNIIRFVQGFQDYQFFFIVLELCPYGSLYDVLKYRRKLRFDEIRFIARNLTQGINYLHVHDIVHRDIKPSNVLFNAKGKACLADFGLAKILSNSGVHTMCGTPIYMAPEINGNRNYDIRSDIWSFGVLMAVAIYGMMNSQNLREFVHRQLKNNTETDEDDDFRIMLRSLIRTNPCNREKNVLRVVSARFFRKYKTLSHLPSSFFRRPSSRRK